MEIRLNKRTGRVHIVMRKLEAISVTEQLALLYGANDDDVMAATCLEISNKLLGDLVEKQPIFTPVTPQQ